MNRDCVFLDRLEVAVRIGTTQAEQAFPQLIHVSVKVFISLRKAGAKDDLPATIDYAAVASEIRSFTERTTFALAEAVAERCAAIALAFPGAEEVFVRVEKRIFTGVDAVGVEIWRSAARS